VTAPFYLIDFENVQPKALDSLKPGASRIKVFLGQHQTKLMLEVVQALQPFGADAEYIPIHGTGPDAADFHIAFYIGRLASAHPGATFNIISKDKGFDPLVKHLAGLGIGCRRLLEIPGAAKAKAIPRVKPKAAAAKPAAGKVAVTEEPASARAKEVVAHLRKSTKPAKLASLRSAIKSWFKPEVLDEKTVDAVIQSLKDSKRIVVTGAKVAYSLG
jgi:hypothetical protein